MKKALGLLSLLVMGAFAPAQADDAGCCNAPGKDFPKVGGNYGNQNYTALSQINKATVDRLGAVWHRNLEGGSKSTYQQASVVVVDGVIFAETSQGNVYAVDGKTGQTKWSYQGGFGIQFRRGLAVGGGKVYVAFGGFHIAALDQKTGAVVWLKQLLDDEVPGTGSPKTAIVYYDGLIYFGTADASRGAAWAVDAGTGAVAWKFFGAPGSGEFGSETWEGDSWKTGGASPWMHPAIDPELGLVYFTFGNARAGAPTDGSARAGQNLFANSLVALNAKTGKRAWHFQSVHHDIWDMDNVMAPVLADVPVAGKIRKIVVYGSKVGMFYVLDRTNGEPITPIIETPVPQQPLQKTWPTQPIPVGDALSPQCPSSSDASRVPPNYQYGCLFTPHLDFPMVQSPGTAGGMDWNALSYNPRTKLIYTGVGQVNSGHVQRNDGVGFRPLGQDRSGKVVAFDPATHKIVWKKDMVWALAHGNGILTTGGDVMFIGQPDGVFLAMDMADGKTLWQFQTGAGVHTSPAGYEIDGQEYVAVFAGGNGLPYDSPKGDDLWAFRLGGKVAQAAAPTPPPLRQPITSTPVEGSIVKDTVNIARTWSNASGLGTTESESENAMAPQVLRVPAGTTVTFVNPAGNAQPHCVTQFFEGLFSSPPLNPGQSFAYKFLKPGEYFYNDCTSPRTTGKIIVD